LGDYREGKTKKPNPMVLGQCIVPYSGQHRSRSGKSCRVDTIHK
jgi:hypothetical protein